MTTTPNTTASGAADTTTLAPTDALTQALRLLTDFHINRYLMSNAHGCWNGAEKAQRHDDLCCIYVAVFFGKMPDAARREHEDTYQAIHRATQELTDNLDTAIGFPLDSRPDYDALVPKFFAEFNRLAMQALAKWGSPAPASGEPETCKCCGEGSARIVVRRECDTCTSVYAGVAEHRIQKALAAPPAQEVQLNPDMPVQELRLHMGELTSDEVLVARAAIRWANSQQKARMPLSDEQIFKAYTTATGKKLLKQGPARPGLLQIFRLAEAAHGIKGKGVGNAE